MATQVGEAVIKLTFDGREAKSELNNTEKYVESFGSKVGSSIKKIGVALTAVFAAGTAAAVKFSKDSIKAFNEAEEAQTKLAQSAKNQNWAESALEDLRTYNSELQKLGIIEDDINAAGQAQLGTFALSAEAVKVLTPAMDDLIAATSGYEATTDSATQMANLMGKVMTGNVGALTRYGVTLDENQKKLLQEGNEMVRAATLAEVLKQNYGGFNEALAKTPQGRVKQLSNAFGDLKESFGAFIAGRGDLDTFFENLETVLDSAVDLIVDMAPKIMEGISRLLTKINEKLPDIIEKLIPVVTDIVIGFATALIENAPLLIDAVIKIVVKVGEAIIKNLPRIIEAIGKALPKAIVPLLAVIGGSMVLGKIKNLVSNFFTGSLKNVVSNGVKGLGNVITTASSSLMKALSTLLKGVGEAISGFIKAFAGPEVIMGAVGFAAAAAAIAAAIWLIGSAVGAIMPVLNELFNNIIMPIANFIADTLMNLIDALTNALVVLTNGALIPLGEFLTSSFVTILTTVSDVIANLTQNALVPLIDTLSGAFTSVLRTVSDLITGVLHAALQGIADIVRACGEGFLMMGQSIKAALDGVSGVLHAFADLIRSIADAVVAVVAMVTGHSINYGAGYAHLFSEGGKVVGPGTATSDSIPAMLSNGEYVINAKSAQAIGYDTLDKLNDGEFRDWTGGLLNSFGDEYSANASGSGKINVYMTNQINNKLDAQEIGQIMLQSIRRAV